MALDPKHTAVLASLSQFHGLVAQVAAASKNDLLKLNNENVNV